MFGIHRPSQNCESCGAELETSGECQPCLLQLGMSGAASKSPGQELLAELPTLEELNNDFPGLELVRLIGRGGMGAIYQARQTNLDRDVALKIIASEVSGDPAFIERFEREAKTLARLSHPHIVTVYDFGRTSSGMAYLIMEYVDGINLREAMNAGTVEPRESLGMVSRICDALQYAHDKGVVHRDIKPENILLGEEGSLKVADFGIAKIIDDSIRTPTLTATRQVLGSLNYLAPEHLEAPGTVDHRVDLYALGVILYELITGELPLGRYEPPSVLQQQATPQIDQIVLRTLSRKPDERYQSAAELSQALSQADLADAIPVITPAPESTYDATGRTASFPFTSEAMGGFAENVGMVYAIPGDSVHVEYRSRDSIFGTVKSETRVIDLPLNRLSRVEMRPSIFGGKFVLAADSITALEGLPNAETGEVIFKVKRNDVARAQEVVNACNIGRPGFQPVLAVGDARAAEGGNWIMFAIFSLLMGVMNAGFLAVLQFVAANELHNDSEAIPVFVGSAVFFGPLSLLQLINGLLALTFRPRNVGKATAIVGLLPLTPVWLLSLPVGIWALSWLKRDVASVPPPMKRAMHNPTPASKQGWGATTMMFVRESRWGKLVAAGNVLAALAACGFLIGWQKGWYPTVAQFRIVNRDVSGSKILDAIRVRGGEYISGYERDGIIQFNITESERNKLLDLVAIEDSIRLTWIQPTTLPTATDSTEANKAPLEKEDGAESVELDIALGLKVPSEYTHSTNIGSVAFASTKGEEIRPDHFSKLRCSGRELTMELTRSGLEKLSEGVTESGTDWIPALVSDEAIIAVGKPQKNARRGFEFTLADNERFNARSVEAAIRGPSIGTPLEHLD
ncbi:MAG: serine/threonine-protein kinase [Aureliella sp.]